MDDIMTAKEVAAYLKINERTVLKYASENQLPAVKVGGQWRFKREVLDRWLESQMQAGPAVSLADEEPVRVSRWLRPDLVQASSQARCGRDVLEELVSLCERAGLVQDGKALLNALIRREQLCSTALGQGVAFPHVRDNAPRYGQQPVVAVVRVPAGVDFGAGDGRPTYLFFLVFAPSTKLHLRILARLSQLFRDPGLVTRLREAPDGPAMVRLLTEAEQQVQPSRVSA